MRAHVLFLAMMCLNVARPRVALAGTTETIDMGAHVTQIDATKRRATIDRGKRAGLAAGVTGELYAVRMAEGNRLPEADIDVRIARGKVVEITDTTAVLSLDAVATMPEVGAYFRYTQAVPSVLAQSGLFRVLALGIEIRPLDGTSPYTTLDAVLAEPALADTMVDDMVADLKKAKARLTTTSRVEQGRFHGKTTAEVLDTITRSDLLDYLLYAESAARLYATRPWQLPVSFMGWVRNGTASGTRWRAFRVVAPTVALAEAATKAGKLDEMRTHWQAVVAAMPDHQRASANVAAIDRVQLWQRQLVADADDTSTRNKLVDALFDLEAYALAVPHSDRLRKVKFEPFDTELRHAKLLVRLEKWRDAETIFARLHKDKPERVAQWLAYARASSRVARAPKDPAAHLALAQFLVEDKAWKPALAAFRRVFELGSTPAQQDAARLGQERVGIQRQLDDRARWARNEIAEHDLAAARDHIDTIVALADKLGPAAGEDKLLKSIAEAAHNADEDELWIELQTKRAERSKNDGAVSVALALALYATGRIDQAHAAATKALTRKGYERGALFVLAQVARARGELGELEKLAKRALPYASKQDAWPHQMLAIAEAGLGNWQDAVEHARKGHALTPDSWDLRDTLNAALRGLQAHEALQAQTGSARERLRLVRALADLALVRRANEEIAKLPADGGWRSEGWWAIAESKDSRLPIADRLTAARAAKPTTTARKTVLARLDAIERHRADPKDAATRLELAKLYLKDDGADAALATLGPLISPKMSTQVSDVVRDARQMIALADSATHASEANARGDHAGAMKLALELQALMDRAGGIQWQGAVREVRVEILTAQGRYPEALAVAEESLARARADGDPERISIDERHVARIRSAVGTNEPLRKALTDALKVCEDLDKDDCVRSVHSELVGIASDDGRLADAIDHARKAWALADRLGRLDKARLARDQLINANLAASRIGDAEQLALALLADSRTHGDVVIEQSTLLTLGVVAMLRADGKSARARFQEVYDLGTRTGATRWRAIARRMEGSAWLAADHDPRKAAAALEHAATLLAGQSDSWSIIVRTTTLRELARARLRDKKLADARSAAGEALALAQRLQRVSSLAASHHLVAQIALEERKLDEAAVSSSRALDLAKQTDDSELLADAWHVVARTRAAQGNDQDALAAFESALEHRARALLSVGSERDRDAYMSTGQLRDLYKHAVEHMLKLGKTKRAMEVLELARDAQLRQSFDAASVQSSDPKVRAKLEKYDQTRARMKGLEKQLGDARGRPQAQRSPAQEKKLGELIARTEGELSDIAIDLRVTHPQLYRALAVAPDSLMSRQGALPPGSVLVEYFVADDSLYAFIISKELKQPAVIRVKVAASTLAQTVVDFRTAIIAENSRTRARDKVEQLGRQLDDWLLEPLRAHLEGVTTVLLVPFGPLYYVPFDALVVSDAGQPVRWAIEDYRFSIQSATTLEHVLKPVRPRGTGTLLAIANPDGSLPGAQREVSRIVKSLPDTRVLSRKDATVARFSELVGGFRIVHLATHGVLDTDPRRSHLKMADGELKVKAIAKLKGLDQSNELVVLSACESATQLDASAGDDMVSLAEGFAMAGAPAMIASLWEVGDDSTAELMATFYRLLEAGSASTDRLDALRNAKLNLIRLKQGNVTPYAAPWHWASFQLFGDYRSPGAK